MKKSYSDGERRYYQEQDVFGVCPDCPHPDRCTTAGFCMMQKAQKGFMGDKYAKRKKGM